MARVPESFRTRRPLTSHNKLRGPQESSIAERLAKALATVKEDKPQSGQNHSIAEAEQLSDTSPGHVLPAFATEMKKQRLFLREVLQS